MNLKVFLELIEIKAKTASVFPFLLGVEFCWMQFHYLNIGNLILFFIAMFLFNMAVDVNDNYHDYLRAQRHEATEFRTKTNIIGVHHLNVKVVRLLLYGLIALSACIGLILVIRTNWILLALGIFCFAVGYFYAAGPRPLSTLPVGEFFAGFTMGTMIFIITVFISIVPTIMFSWEIVIKCLLPSAPVAFAIAALLLANNICDEKEDLELNRLTIVAVLGKKRALILFNSLYLLGAISLIFAVICGLQPKLTLLSFLVTPIIINNVRKFHHVQIKKITFKLAIQNLLVISLAQTFAVALGLLINI